MAKERKAQSTKLLAQDNSYDIFSLHNLLSWNVIFIKGLVCKVLGNALLKLSSHDTYFKNSTNSQPIQGLIASNYKKALILKFSLCLNREEIGRLVNNQIPLFLIISYAYCSITV